MDMARRSERLKTDHGTHSGTRQSCNEFGVKLITVILETAVFEMSSHLLSHVPNPVDSI